MLSRRVKAKHQLRGRRPIPGSRTARIAAASTRGATTDGSHMAGVRIYNYLCVPLAIENILADAYRLTRSYHDTLLDLYVARLDMYIG
jgi:hypothetical protein